MASTLEAVLTTQQLRTYYLTGKGLEELAPAGPFVTEDAAPVQVSPDTSVPVQPAALGPLHAAALAEARQPARQEFRRLLASYRDKLRSVLEVEQSHDPSATSAQNLSAQLGKDASQFFNTEVLSQALSRAPGGTRKMPPDRRARIEASHAALASYLREDEQTPAVVECSLADAGLRAATLLQSFGRALQALEVARLESESQYDPALHDDAIACIDWHAADSPRLAALPPIVVSTDPATLQSSLGALAAIVETRLPVQVIVRVEALSNAADLRGAVFGMRQAVVLSSVMGSTHLGAGLRHMAAVLRTAVAFVVVPESSDDATARRQCALAVAARLAPLFLFQPDAGTALSEQLVWQPAGDAIAVASAAASFASAAKLFRILPDDAPSTLPAVMTRERRRAVFPAGLVQLESAARASWRFFEEIAGVGNSFVEAAVANARQQAEAAATARLEDSLRQARSEGARNAVSRLVAVLTNPQASVAGAMAATPTPAFAAAAPVAAVAAPAPAAQPPAATGATEDPYIDSFLCTSCNDCMKINPRMFQYNADKQAYLADASAGTYAELVKAAAGCPAKCIHPGSPR